MQDITEPLQHMGDATQEVGERPLKGEEVTRLAMRIPNALKELAAVQDALFKGIASAVGSLGSSLGASETQDMARQGAIDGRAAVTRDANGDIQVQPTTQSLFGPGGSHYANAMYVGTHQAIKGYLENDLRRIAGENIGNPEGMKQAFKGYFDGHEGSLGASPPGKAALLDGRLFADSLYTNALNQNAAAGIQSSRENILAGIKADQTSLEALAQGGMAGNPEYTRTLAHQNGLYDSLHGNPSFGITPDSTAIERKDNSLRINSAAIQGGMASAFQNGGINAAAGS